MKIYIVVETTQDYKGAYTTIWGASESQTRAEEILKDAVLELNEYEESAYERGLDGGEWIRDDGDIYQKFSIVETEVL